MRQRASAARGRAPSMLAASALVLTAACVPSTERGLDEPRLHHTSAGEVSGPYLAVGTTFDVELVKPIVVPPASEEAPFLASVREDLLGPDGTVVVRRGALLHGLVVRANDRALVDLTLLRTMAGDIPLSAAPPRAARAAVPAPYDFIAAPMPAGARLALTLTRPFVPAGSSFR